MKRNFLKLFLVLLLTVTFIQTSDAQRKKRKKKKDKTEVSAKKKKDKKQIKPYNEVITDKAVTDKGLFDVHRVKEDYFYEIPKTLLGKEMLMVTRIAKTSSGIQFGGEKTNTQVLRWVMKDKKIFLKQVSYSVVADKELPVHQAVANSNMETILFSFPIKAFSKDENNVVINVTSMFIDDVNTLGLPSYYKKRFKISKPDKTRSYIESIKSFPMNIENRHIKTYFAKKAPSRGASQAQAITVEMSNSMVLLPETPMKRRYFDKRVGWFTSSQVDYGLEAHKSKKVTFLDRWKLEVKDEDIEKFKRGELVEPKKQIVYYIDQATPVKWRKYLIEGINDWQVAFEAAGFKNAIIAKMAPTAEEDPEFSPEDVRYSVVRYLASDIPNANGPHVSDPRTGEILETDINWYHNVMTLLRNWYFVQTSAVNDKAQTTEFSDEVMGELIKFVSSHEVGHTLGLPHNMGASSAYPVDSLRSAIFTQKYGTAPSIMDYARFNYVAQPEDKGVAMMPNIGIYDKYAVSWGYRPIMDKSAVEEKETLNAWITKHDGDKLYRFGKQQRGVIDPSSQTEDLGDDAVKASNYGIKNLKRTMTNLVKWTYKEGEDFDELEELYGQVLSQYNRYMGHVSANIGGVYENYKAFGQDGDVYSHVAKSKQRNSVNFLNKQLFKTPKWIINKEILRKTQSTGAVKKVRTLQLRTLNSLLSVKKLHRVIENKALNGKSAYSIGLLMKDLRNGIWSELKSGKSIDSYRRNLQRAHIEILSKLLEDNSDVRSYARNELIALKYMANRSAVITKDEASKYHLKDIKIVIMNILDPK
ncbi:MAG: zinc-dependent metalloprotease [Flavobacteriaceae bacterium]|nr:zinc-dependent metalloprotease [Flavobacteriaceae bacterium]